MLEVKSWKPMPIGSVFSFVAFVLGMERGFCFESLRRLERSCLAVESWVWRCEGEGPLARKPRPPERETEMAR